MNHPLIAYFHICTIGNWKEVVREQMETLVSSGLYQHLSELNYSVVGVECNDNFIEKVLGEKANCVFTDNNPNLYEYPTLSALHKQASDNPDAYYLYFHTKGVTVAAHGQPSWRRMMMHWNIEKWKECITAFDQNEHVGAIGCDFMIHPTPAFAGNFWWARGNYLNSLPQPQPSNNRYVYEFWVLSGELNVLELYNSRRVPLHFYSKSIADIEYKVVPLPAIHRVSPKRNPICIDLSAGISHGLDRIIATLKYLSELEIDSQFNNIKPGLGEPRLKRQIQECQDLIELLSKKI